MIRVTVDPHYCMIPNMFKTAIMENVQWNVSLKISFIKDSADPVTTKNKNKTSGHVREMWRVKEKESADVLKLYSVKSVFWMHEVL